MDRLVIRLLPLLAAVAACLPVVAVADIGKCVLAQGASTVGTGSTAREVALDIGPIWRTGTASIAGKLDYRPRNGYCVEDINSHQLPGFVGAPSKSGIGTNPMRKCNSEHWTKDIAFEVGTRSTHPHPELRSLAQHYTQLEVITSKDGSKRLAYTPLVLMNCKQAGGPTGCMALELVAVCL